MPADAPSYDKPVFHERSAINEALNAGAVSAAAGLFMSALQNSVQRHSAGAMGIFTRTGGTIALFSACSTANKPLLAPRSPSLMHTPLTCVTRATALAVPPAAVPRALLLALQVSAFSNQHVRFPLWLVRALVLARLSAFSRKLARRCLTARMRTRRRPQRSTPRTLSLARRSSAARASSSKQLITSS